MFGFNKTASAAPPAATTMDPTAVSPGAAPVPAKPTGITGKLRAAASDAAQSVSAFVSSPATTQGSHTGVMAKIINVKRRVEENVLQATGHAQAQPDEEYLFRKQALAEYRALLTDTRKHVTTFIDATRSMCFVCDNIGGDAQKAFTGLRQNDSAKVEIFVDGMKDFDQRYRTATDEAFMAQVLAPLDAAIAEIDALQPRMRDRELLKTDFDSRARKVRSIKESGSGGDISQLPHTEEKLARTRDTLLATTAALYNTMDAIECKRFAFFADLLGRIGAVQRKYFADGVRMSNALPLDGIAAINYAAAPSRFQSAAAPTPQSTSFASAPIGGGPAARALPVAPQATQRERVRALYEYAATGADELSLQPGDVLVILERREDGWWKGLRERDGVSGLFPSNFVAPIAAA